MSTASRTAGKELVGPKCQTCGGIETPAKYRRWKDPLDDAGHRMRTCDACEDDFQNAKVALDQPGYWLHGQFISPMIRAWRALLKVGDRAAMNEAT